jgi:hypothetical protein
MPDLTLVQRFGTNATIDTTTPTNPKLVITLKNLQDVSNTGDITDGLGLDDASLITNVNKDQYASKILHALLILNYQKQPIDNTDNTVGVYITNGGKRFVTRNTVNQVEYRLTAQAYKDDSTGILVDPDDIAPLT